MNLNRSYKIVFVALLAAQNLWAAAPTNNAVAARSVAAPVPVDYKTFPSFIANRNIFDPNRVPHVPWRTNPPPTHYVQQVRQPASFSLVGIIGYGDGKLAGAYAFFDGTSQQYRRTVQLNGDIAAFKVADIAADSVTLVTGTNSQTVLRLGDQLHDDGAGHWLTASGNDVRFNTSANGRFNNRNGGFNNQNGNGGRGNRQRGNGNNNYGGFNQNNNNGNFNNNNGGGNIRVRNNFGGGTQTFDNSQAQDPNAGAQDYNSAPVVDMVPQNFIAPPDFNQQPDQGQQNN